MALILKIQPKKTEIIEYMVDCLGYNEQQDELQDKTPEELWKMLAEEEKIEYTDFIK